MADSIYRNGNKDQMMVLCSGLTLSDFFGDLKMKMSRHTLVLLLQVHCPDEIYCKVEHSETDHIAFKDTLNKSLGNMYLVDN